ncbi:MAG: type II toxin-antitoxin system RelE/ParE family toxin [Caldilineaceae bacterium]|nr:type II toxin-antitoxin system RelE/ParE family toxin [Caldilineaceae bacterium]
MGNPLKTGWVSGLSAFQRTLRSRRRFQPALAARRPANLSHRAAIPARAPKVFSTGCGLVRESIWRFAVITRVVILLPMIQSFRNPGSEDIFDGLASRAARKCCPQSIWPVARRKLDQINRVGEVAELRVPPGNHLERLKGDREDQYSIRINQQYRICFVWEEGHAYEVEITDYH